MKRYYQAFPVQSQCLSLMTLLPWAVPVFSFFVVLLILPSLAFFLKISTFS